MAAWSGQSLRTDDSAPVVIVMESATLGTGYCADDPGKRYPFGVAVVIDATDDRVLLLQEGDGMMLQASTFPLTAILDDKWTQHLELTRCLWLRELARHAPLSSPQQILDAAP